MSGCCPTEEKKCDCLCHSYDYPADYDFSGSVCCDCHKNNNGKMLKFEPVFPKHPMQELIDKFENRFASINESLESCREHGTVIEALEADVMYLQKIVDSIASKDLDKEVKKRHWLILEVEKYESRIESLESQIKASTEMYKHISALVAGLQDHHVRQVDENRKISKRIDSVDKHSSQNEGHCIGLESRIEKLESNHLDQLNPHAFLILKTRCDELERLINAVKDSYNNICAPSLRKEPFKCPICEGKGYWNTVENNIACGGRCSTCEGRGIVWGQIRRGYQLKIDCHQWQLQFYVE